MHIANKHSTASKTKFECTFCKKELSSAVKLKVHEKNHAYINNHVTMVIRETSEADDEAPTS